LFRRSKYIFSNTHPSNLFTNADTHISEHADIALSTAGQLFAQDTLHNGKGDAFRHCYWNARMTIDIGKGDAKTIGDNHEDGSNGPEREKTMDRANNASGRDIGQNAVGGSKNAKYDDAKIKCQNAANSGRLVTL
jgi:hypothetical protein